jgi:hypothetical protein
MTKTPDDGTILSKTDVASYESLIDDLKTEAQIPQNGTWDYVVKLMILTSTPGTYAYIGSYLYIDGPLVAKSSGIEPSYRRIIYVGGADWSDEHIFSYVREVFNHIRTKHPLIKRYPFVRVGKHFVAQAVDTVDLS